MPDKYPYYIVNKYHEKIFGKPDKVSYYELLFAVEAPQFFSGINIWRYCDRVPIAEVLRSVAKISNDELTKPCVPYPFYDLFSQIWTGDLRSPLIFKGFRGESVCIEGRHRLRLLTLFYNENPEVFEKRIGNIPIVFVEEVEGESEKNLPEKYNEWARWLSDNNIITDSKRKKAIYEKFLLGK